MATKNNKNNNDIFPHVFSSETVIKSDIAYYKSYFNI